MKHETLGDVVLDALEEYKPTEGKHSKFRNSLDRVITRHGDWIIYGSAAVLGMAGYFLAPWAFNQLKSPGTYLLPDKIQALRGIGAITLALTDWTITTGLVYQYAGARIYSKTEYKPDKKHQKIGKFFRYPKTLGFGLAVIVTALRFPHNILPPYENKELLNLGLYIGALGGALSTMAYILRDIEHQGKQGWKNLGSVYIGVPAKIAGIFSTDKKISMLERIIEKNDYPYLKIILASTLQKKSVFESLNYSKEVLDQIKNMPGSQDYVKLKKWAAGVVAKYLFKKKRSWVATFDLLKKIQKVDNEAAKTIVREVRKSIPDDNLDEHFLLDYYSKDFIEKDYEVPLADFVHKVKARAEKDKNIKRFASSEAINVWVYTGSKLIGRSVVIKEYDFDFFERFLKQRFEHETLRNSGIKTENPLVFMREGEKSVVLTTMEGDKTLRECLKDKDKIYKRQVFEKVIEQGIIAQKILYERVRREDRGSIVNVDFDGKKHSVRMEILDLEQHLIRKAFLGKGNTPERFGRNEYLDELLKKILQFKDEKYKQVLMTINHGDYFTFNITENYARIDGRQILADTLYDTTYIALDPVFLELTKDEKMEINLRALKKIYDISNQPLLCNSFNSLYFINSLCVSSSHMAHEKIDEAARILQETLNLAKGMPFEKDLILYLNTSKAKELMKLL